MSLEDDIRGLGEPIPGGTLAAWRMRRPDGQVTPLGEKDLLFLWWWRKWYPETNLKKQRVPFSSGFESELKQRCKDEGLTLKISAEHLSKIGLEQRAFLYEFDARVTGCFRLSVPFYFLNPLTIEGISVLELKHKVNPWTDLRHIFSEFSDFSKHGNSVPRKQPHQWHIIEERDRSIFQNEKLSDTHRSQWSKIRREVYEPYAKVIYSAIVLR